MARKRKQVGTPRDDENIESDDIPAETENRRGRTVLALVGKAIQRGVKIPLEWNHNNVPTGVNRENFATYIGVVVRERVSINCLTWDDVLENDKNEVFNFIEKGFDVPIERKGYVLGRASIRWRSFKARLRKDWMYESNGENENQIIRTPPAIYPWILQSDWDKFIKTYTDPKFLELSELNRERAKKKTSSYRGGRKGYLYYEEEIARELLKQNILAKDVPRHLVWIRAHSRQEDNVMYFDNPADLEVAEAIKALEAQQIKGEIDATGRNDILGRALKTPEHGGSVRGVGSGVTNKQYFGYNKPPPPSQLQSELRRVKSKLANFENNHNLLVSYIVSGDFNPEKLKELLISNANQSNLRSREDDLGGKGFEANQTFETDDVHCNKFNNFDDQGIQNVRFQLGDRLIFSKDGSFDSRIEGDHVFENEADRLKTVVDSLEKEAPIETYRVPWPETEGC